MTARGLTFNSTANYSETITANLATTGHAHLNRHSNLYSHRHLQSHGHAHTNGYLSNRIESVAWPLPGPKVTSESEGWDAGAGRIGATSRGRSDSTLASTALASV